MEETGAIIRRAVERLAPPPPNLVRRRNDEAVEARAVEVLGDFPPSTQMDEGTIAIVLDILKRSPNPELDLAEFRGRQWEVYASQNSHNTTIIINDHRSWVIDSHNDHSDHSDRSDRSTSTTTTGYEVDWVRVWAVAMLLACAFGLVLQPYRRVEIVPVRGGMQVYE